MKKHLKIFATLAVALLAAACSKENPFPGPDSSEQGYLSKEALSLTVGNEEGMEKIFSRPAATRAEAPKAGDFTVKFYKEDTGEEVDSYLFSEMPEVVTLPVGAIRAEATFGDNAAQAWEAPFFKGETKFVVSAGRVTDDVEPIVARLSNVRVTIVFAPGLLDHMSADSKVTVVVGEQGTLDFDRTTGDKSGYFAHVENSQTLTATFNGKIDGFDTVETKGYDNVAPGNHYRITFKLHSQEEDGEGDINGNLAVDATVEVVDMNVSVDPDDEVIDDDMRPVQGDPENPDNPDKPGPTPGEKTAPTIEAKEPAAGKTGVKFDEWNDISVSDQSGIECAFSVTSSAEGGITKLDVVIDSPNLTESELAQVGLQKNLDLVNTEPSLASSLGELGFPVNVGGKSSVDFDITSFLPMLAIFGANDHQFIITVSDANGTVTKSLKLRFK